MQQGHDGPMGLNRAEQRPVVGQDVAVEKQSSILTHQLGLHHNHCSLVSFRQNSYQPFGDVDLSFCLDFCTYGLDSIASSSVSFSRPLSLRRCILRCNRHSYAHLQHEFIRHEHLRQGFRAFSTHYHPLVPV
jgi:hypothetical protein